MAQKKLDPHMWNLENLFKCIYNVPVYQRPYSWDREQIQVLLGDIYDSYTGPDKDFEHFKYYMQDNETLMLKDGQTY